MSESMIANLIQIGVLIAGFIGTSLYLRGNISARLDAHDKLMEKNGGAIDDLYDKANELQKCKAEESHITVWRAELKVDFQSFKDDVRENIREFKQDVQTDINNVLIAIKQNGSGIK